MADGSTNEPYSFRTLCTTIRDPEHRDQYGASSMPVYLTATFKGLPGAEFDYSRSGNPTRDVLAETLADLEGGAGAVITATGMAAVDLPLSLLEPDDLLIAPHDCYGGTHRLLTARAQKGHFRVAFVDQNDGAALDAALADGCKLVLVETPSNPLLRVTDIADPQGSAGIVEAVVNIAAERSMTTTAEGVETAQQQQLLRELGCSEMQGYLFSRPVPAQDVRTLLAAEGVEDAA